MKILNISQIREADIYTFEHEPISSIDLMERAAQTCAKWCKKKLATSRKIHIFCGVGNNGADGLAMARLMANRFKNIKVYAVYYSPKKTPEFDTNLESLKTFEKIEVIDIRDHTDFEKIKIEKKSVVIDCLFGSGLNRNLTDWIAELIKLLNLQKAYKLAIDMPSGLRADSDPDRESTIFEADHTLTLGLPKRSLFYDSNFRFVGTWETLDIGLHPEATEKLETDCFFTELYFIEKIKKIRPKISHKGSFGRALLVAGSYGKIGACLMAAKACLRAGAGLLTVHAPKCAYTILQQGVPEAMLQTDKGKKIIKEICDYEAYTTIGIGCGLGTAPKTQKTFLKLIKNYSKPMVLDADALNILAQNPEYWDSVPKGSILTPHPKEFERITNCKSVGYERHQTQIEFAKRYGLCVVLKGAHTCTVLPDGRSFFNTTGNAGMASAGSGDVLTGILTGLLARGYSPEEAAILGVYWHGAAGDAAEKIWGQESMNATDIIANMRKF